MTLKGDKTNSMKRDNDECMVCAIAASIATLMLVVFITLAVIKNSIFMLFIGAYMGVTSCINWYEVIKIQKRHKFRAQKIRSK